jgi:hypothetical protein
MKNKISLISFSLIILALLACNSILPFGKSAVGINELPVYPGAVELKEGESNIADTLAQNEQQNAALNQALGSLGGGELEQKGFQLPSEATWEQVNGYYEKELTAAGWSNGVGGLANSFVDVNAILQTANEGNELFKTAIWSKGDQTLTVIMVTDPVDQTQKQLLFSLSTR